MYCTPSKPTPAQQTFDNAPPTTPTVPSSGTYAGYICPAYDTYNELFYNGCYTSASAGATFTHNWVPYPHSNWNGCVTDRDEPYDTRNDTPSGGSDDDPTKFPVAQGMGCPAPITPLSNDANALKTNIGQMVALNLGTTNQLIGLAWGWMSLKSGNPFGSGNPLNAPADLPGVEVRRSVIILSDGMNTQSRMYGGAYLGYNGTAVTIDSREKILCDNMKADGITIYAIQVNTDGEPKSAALSYCASDPSDFFYLTSASQVLDTFNAIQAKLSSLRITH